MRNGRINSADSAKKKHIRETTYPKTNGTVAVDVERLKHIVRVDTGVYAEMICGWNSCQMSVHDVMSIALNHINRLPSIILTSMREKFRVYLLEAVLLHHSLWTLLPYINV